MLKEKDTKLATGLTLAFYGVLSLLSSFGVLQKFMSVSLRAEVLDWRTAFLYAAAFFLIFKKDKTIGLILLVIGLLFRFRTIYGYLAEYQFLFWPVVFVTTGSVLIFTSLRK